MSSVKLKRGQGATEYLVILGAVLLVALVIISLLGWFPSLGGSTREAQSKQYWSSTSPFSVTAIKLSSGGTLDLTLANRLGDKVNLTAVSFYDGVNFVNITPNAAFNPGEEKTLTGFAAAGAGNLCVGAASGAAFEYKTLTFTYNQGSLSGLLQVGVRPFVASCS